MKNWSKKKIFGIIGVIILIVLAFGSCGNSTPPDYITKTHVFGQMNIQETADFVAFYTSKDIDRKSLKQFKVDGSKSDIESTNVNGLKDTIRNAGTNDTDINLKFDRAWKVTNDSYDTSLDSKTSIALYIVEDSRAKESSVQFFAIAKGKTGKDHVMTLTDLIKFSYLCAANTLKVK